MKAHDMRLEDLELIVSDRDGLRRLVLNWVKKIEEVRMKQGRLKRNIRKIATSKWLIDSKAPVFAV